MYLFCFCLAQVAIKDLAGRVEELRHNIAVVEATQTEQRARFRRECDKIVDEARWVLRNHWKTFKASQVRAASVKSAAS